MATAASTRTCVDCGVALNPRSTERGTTRCRACANRVKAGTFTRQSSHQVGVAREHRHRTILECAAELLPREWESLARRFTEQELAVLRHVVRGTHWDAATIPHLADEVDEAIRAEGTLRWAFDVEALLSMLRELSLTQAWAAVTALERRGVGRNDSTRESAAPPRRTGRVRPA